jgi:NADPH-dependent 2,4-dienoyl-CoA reductase/sulfur reductase-like enzyme
MTDPVVIVGAGPAGLAAARTLAARGIACVVLDDNARPGGQYLRQPPPGVAAPRLDPRGASLFAALDHALVEYRPGVTVWAAPAPLTLAYAGAGGSGRVRARAIVLATGAQDRPCPFPGWTLPGVIAAGGCLNLVKGQGMVPTGAVVVAGNGPLVLLTAAVLLRLGVRVRAVAEAARPTRRPGAALACAAAGPGVFARGIAYRARLLRAGVPYLEGTAILRAEGGDEVASVTLARVGPDGRPLAETARAFPADWLVTGYGLQPATELSRLLGCREVFSPSRGGWVPSRSPVLETSVAHVFAVGEAGGIGGADAAFAEGAFVARTIAARLGAGRAPRPSALRRVDRARKSLAALYALPAPIDLADRETIICRCEEITAATLDAAARRCDGDLGRIKTETRLSMGRCQGRNCLAPAAAIVASACGTGPESLPWPRARPPARPVPLDALLTEPLPPPRAPDAPLPDVRTPQATTHA